MDKGIYTALSGGIAKAHELDLIANNLANVNTVGFKADSGTFNEYLSELRKPGPAESNPSDMGAFSGVGGRPSGDKSLVEMDATYTDFSQGHLESTGRPLDMAVDGKGFFEVLTPSGIRYTREGNFKLSPDGTLVTVNGYPVLSRGAGGNPAARAIHLRPGPFVVTGGGAIVQEGQPVANLSLQEFLQPQWLEKVGQSYFRNIAPENLKAGATETKVVQSFLEGSNVNPVSAMTKLIEVTREYESNLQAIKTYQEIDTHTVNELARR